MYLHLKKIVEIRLEFENFTWVKILKKKIKFQLNFNNLSSITRKSANDHQNKKQVWN